MEVHVIDREVTVSTEAFRSIRCMDRDEMFFDLDVVLLPLLGLLEFDPFSGRFECDLVDFEFLERID